ncbi:MAG: hypothetical protein PVI62_11560 [Desulfobacterales bacterium]
MHRPSDVQHVTNDAILSILTLPMINVSLREENGIPIGMNDKGSRHAGDGGVGVLTSEKIYLTPNGGVARSRGCFYQPMYKDLSEVLELVKLSFEGTFGQKFEYIRTFEGGTFGESEWTPASYVGFEVEEYFVYEKGDNGRSLLFRIQPILLSHNKMVEYKMYKEDSALGELISHYLGIYARMNNATLVLKN